MDYNQQRRGRQMYGYRQNNGCRNMNASYQSSNQAPCQSPCQAPEPMPMPDARPVPASPRPMPRSGQGCPGASENGIFSANDYALAMAYVKWQQWGSVYTPHEGLSIGTIFPCLNKPFCAGRCRG